MNINPTKMLERFEEKHGDYTDILERYFEAKDHKNTISEAHQERLMKKHDKLIWMLMGYDQGIKDVTEGRVKLTGEAR